jgi:hypothetical protein
MVKLSKNKIKRLATCRKQVGYTITDELYHRRVLNNSLSLRYKLEREIEEIEGGFKFCKDCGGGGEHCHSGSAHPLNWYACSTCKGKGKIQCRV